MFSCTNDILQTGMQCAKNTMSESQGLAYFETSESLLLKTLYEPLLWLYHAL